MLTAEVPNPIGYGRIVRDRLRRGDGDRRGEGRRPTSSERSREINSGIFAFDAGVLCRGARRGSVPTTPRASSTSPTCVAIAAGDGRRVGRARRTDLWQTEGVNTRAQLSRLGRELNRRTLEHWMPAGVDVVDPATTWVDVDGRAGRGRRLLPGTQLHGRHVVETGAVIGPDTTLTDVRGRGAGSGRAHPRLGRGPRRRLHASGRSRTCAPAPCSARRARSARSSRPRTPTSAPGAKVPHLSYVGDAEIGEGTNIGAGTIVANYDGVAQAPHDGRVARPYRRQQHVRRAGRDRRRRRHRRRHRRTPRRRRPERSPSRAVRSASIADWVLSRRPETMAAEAARKAQQAADTADRRRRTERRAADGGDRPMSSKRLPPA